MKNKNEIIGGELTDLPNEKYKQFFDKFSEIETLNIKEWKPVHLIAYFCKKYEKQYGIKYQFKFNSPSPAKCFEIFQIKKLAMLLSSDPTILHDYIDWIFLNKVIKAKRRLTSISFMTSDDVTQEYKMNVLLADKKNNMDRVDRFSLLPEKYLQVFKDCNIDVYTYGELAFISQIDPLPENIAGAIHNIEKLGFDKEILSRIV